MASNTDYVLVFSSRFAWLSECSFVQYILEAVYRDLNDDDNDYTKELVTSGNRRLLRTIRAFLERGVQLYQATLRQQPNIIIRPPDTGVKFLWHEVYDAAVKFLVTPQCIGENNDKPIVYRFHVHRYPRGPHLTPEAQAEAAFKASQTKNTTKRSTAKFKHLFIEVSTSDSQVGFLIHKPIASTVGLEQLDPVASSTLFTFDPNKATVNDLLTSVDFVSELCRGIPNDLTDLKAAPGSISVTLGLFHEKPGLTSFNNKVPVGILLSRVLVPALLVPDQKLFLRIHFPSTKKKGYIRLLRSEGVTIEEKNQQLSSFQKHIVHRGQRMPTYPNDGLQFMGASLIEHVAWAKRYLGVHLVPLLTHDGTALHSFKVWKTGSGGPGDTPGTSGLGVFPMLGDEKDGTGDIHIGLAADWGAGTMEADMVQAAMMGTHTEPEKARQPWSTLRTPHYTIHLGGVYFYGLKEEVEMNFLGRRLPDESRCKYLHGVQWPAGSRGRLAVPGNQEMRTGGSGFFDTLLPSMWVNVESQAQEASYFALSHPQWLLIALDTGYGSYLKFDLTQLEMSTPIENSTIDLHKLQKEWLDELLNNPQHKHKGLVFMSYHQVASAWTKPSTTGNMVGGFSDAKVTFQRSVLQCIKDTARCVVWLYGHERRLSVYNMQQSVSVKDQVIPLRCYHRSVGNSGFPCEVTEIPAEARKHRLQAYDDRVYQVQVTSGQIDHHSLPITFNGFTRLTIKAGEGGRSELNLDYYTLSLASNNDLTSKDPTKMYSETFHHDEMGSIYKVTNEHAENVWPAIMTRVVHVEPPTVSSTSADTLVKLDLTNPWPLSPSNSRNSSSSSRVADLPLPPSLIAISSVSVSASSGSPASPLTASDIVENPDSPVLEVMTDLETRGKSAASPVHLSLGIGDEPNRLSLLTVQDTPDLSSDNQPTTGLTFAQLSRECSNLVEANRQRFLEWVTTHRHKLSNEDAPWLAFQDNQSEPIVRADSREDAWSSVQGIAYVGHALDDFDDGKPVPAGVALSQPSHAVEQLCTHDVFISVKPALPTQSQMIIGDLQKRGIPIPDDLKEKETTQQLDKFMIMVDTGAAFVHLPSTAVEALDLRFVGVKHIIPANGKTESHMGYEALVKVDREFHRTIVVPTGLSMLGRSILGKLYMFWRPGKKCVLMDP